jgi:hypothetical protein
MQNRKTVIWILFTLRTRVCHLSTRSLTSYDTAVILNHSKAWLRFRQVLPFYTSQMGSSVNSVCSDLKEVSLSVLNGFYMAPWL